MSEWQKEIVRDSWIYKKKAKEYKFKWMRSSKT